MPPDYTRGDRDLFALQLAGWSSSFEPVSAVFLDPVGGNTKDIRFTEAIRPRSGQQVPVCRSCQEKVDISQFPPGIFFPTWRSMGIRKIMIDIDGPERWKHLRADGGTAESVPDVVKEMLAASSEGAARDAYWRVDNVVVVQGQLFESAEATAALIVRSICNRDYTVHGLGYALDLLVELAYGEAHDSEVRFGNQALGDHVDLRSHWSYLATPLVRIPQSKCFSRSSIWSIDWSATLLQQMCHFIAPARYKCSGSRELGNEESSRSCLSFCGSRGAISGDPYFECRHGCRA